MARVRARKRGWFGRIIRWLAAGLFLFIVGVKRGLRVEGIPAERAPDTDGERSD